jgi:CDP-paratose 2-epimerase
MNIALVTGSSGLIGGESVGHFASSFDLVIGIDNDMRAYFFGSNASTEWNKKRLIDQHTNFSSVDVDIRDFNALGKSSFCNIHSDIKLIVHTAAQPSHDWAAQEPLTDFGVNATGTLHMLELYQKTLSGSRFHFYFDQ